MEGGGASPSSSPSDDSKCYGMLYFSSARWEAGKLPSCIGANTRVSPEAQVSHNPESLPGGDFKYLCMGCSVYSSSLYSQQRSAASSSTESVQLPLCEGVEVISAAEFQPGAVPLGTQVAANAETSQPGPPSTAQPRPSRLFDGRSGLWAPWQAASNMDLATFCQRLQRNTEKVGRQLVHNVQLVGTSLYSAAKQTTEEIRRRGGQ